MSDVGFEYGEEGKKMLQLLLKIWKIILTVICTEFFEKKKKKNAFAMLSKIEKLTSINRMGKFWSEAKKEFNLDLRNWLNCSWKSITETVF